MTFGQYLRHRRFMRRMPLNEVVAVTGLSSLHLLDLETDRDVPSREDIARLATALHVAEEALLEKARHVRPSAL